MKLKHRCLVVILVCPTSQFLYSSQQLDTGAVDVFSVSQVSSQRAASSVDSKKDYKRVNPLMSARDVTKYFIGLYHSSSLDEAPLDKLKVQKLLYYAQGYFLALFGEGLFKEPIEAWEHGPVIRVIFDDLKENEDNIIPQNLYAKKTKLTSSPLEESLVQGHVNVIYKMFALYSGADLRHCTHNEAPWIIAYQKGRNSVITDANMRNFFMKSENLLKFFEFNLYENQTDPDKLRTTIHEIRRQLSYYLQNLSDIDDFYKFFMNINQLNPAIIKSMYVACEQDFSWSHQSKLNSVMSYLFFPLQYELLYEPPMVLHHRQHLTDLLIHSARHKNPLAHAHLEKILDLYQQDAKSSDSDDSSEELCNLGEEARNLVKQYGARELAAETKCPALHTGLLQRACGHSSTAKQFFKKGYEQGNASCAYYYALLQKDLIEDKNFIDFMEKNNKSGHLFFLQALNEESNDEKKIELCVNAGNAGMVEGFYHAGLLIEHRKKDSDTACEYFLLAARQHILSGYDKGVAHLLKQQKYDEAEKICQESKEVGNSKGFVLLGNLFYQQDKFDKALETYEKAGSDGYFYLRKMKDNPSSADEEYTRKLNEQYHTIRQDAGYELD